MPSATACEAMCRPSAKSAIEPNSTPAAISTTIMVAVIAITSCVLLSPGRRRSWPNEWSWRQRARASSSMTFARSRDQRIAASVHAQDQALRIVGFRKFGRHRMVRGLREPLENVRRSARIDCGAGDDLLEQRGVDVPGARERRENAARPDERQAEHVDVLVAAAAGIDLLGRVHELGRVEHDEIETRALLAHGAQLVEHVCGDERAPVGYAVRRR